jgi:uncharacterized membrane protein
MNKSKRVSLSILLLLVSGLFFISSSLKGQVNPQVLSALPDDVKAIVTRSCMPCHSSEGGLMSRSKLNLTSWAEYTPEKQKEKADKMYTELKKGSMPPRKVKEAKPEIIPTAEQLEVIRIWAESLAAVNK